MYVDDLIVTGTSSTVITRFKLQMQDKFSRSNLGRLSYYLGIEVHQGDSAITLKQAAYAAKLVEKAGLAGCNPVHIPMEARLKLSKESPNAPADTKLYRSIVGSLSSPTSPTPWGTSAASWKHQRQSTGLLSGTCCAT